MRELKCLILENLNFIEQLATPKMKIEYINTSHPIETVLVSSKLLDLPKTPQQGNIKYHLVFSS